MQCSHHWISFRLIIELKSKPMGSVEREMVVSQTWKRLLSPVQCEAIQEQMQGYALRRQVHKQMAQSK